MPIPYVNLTKQIKSGKKVHTKLIKSNFQKGQFVGG